MNDNILTFTPKPVAEISALSGQMFYHAVVNPMTADNQVTVTVNGLNYKVVGYLSQTKGLVPNIEPGDQVCISAIKGEEGIADGVLIHGVYTAADAPQRAHIGYEDGKLLIEAQGAILLKSGNSTIELTEAGEVRVDGKTVRTVAEDVSTVARESLTLLGGKVEVN